MKNSYTKCQIVQSPTTALKLIEELQLLVDIHGDGYIELSCQSREIQFHYEHSLTEDEILKRDIYNLKYNKDKGYS
jgi:hypothetical protein